MPTRRICPNCRTPTFAEGVSCRVCRHELNPDHLGTATQTAQRMADPRLPEYHPITLARAAHDAAEDDDDDLADLPQHRHVIWLERLRTEWRSSALLIVSVICASLGWGAAIGVLGTTRAPKTAPGSTSVNAVLTTDLSAKLHARDQELSSLMVQLRMLSAQLDATRHKADERAAQAAKAGDAQRAVLAQLEAQSGSLAALRQQVADLKNDNAGLEQNYTDLLNSLHRTQDETFRDEKLLVAAAAAEKRAVAQVAAVKAAFARASIAKYHKSR